MFSTLTIYNQECILFSNIGKFFFVLNVFFKTWLKTSQDMASNNTNYDQVQAKDQKWICSVIGPSFLSASSKFLLCKNFSAVRFMASFDLSRTLDETLVILKNWFIGPYWVKSFQGKTTI